ncbi:septum formation initiator family protein [Pseudarthrobacter sp. 1C304]|uniref:septum formation initiator family protein n=1 Tax=Pseudarthrobacter sp. 1C304 TaxID=3457438 RepID=UPI003FD0FAC6
MATRRPKVPRATPAAPKSPEAGDGGDVIQADFGGTRGAHPGPAGKTAPHPAVPGQHPGHAARAGSGPAKSGPAKSGPVKPGPAKSGAATSGAAKSGGAKSAAAGTGPAQKPAAPGTPGKAAATGPAPGTGPGEEHPVPAKAFSGRMLALLVVMIAITIMLAPTVKIYFEKRAEIAALEADIAAKQSEQDDLRRQVSRWQDPNYVKQQARDRINMVMPGETGYWVFGSDLPAGSTGGAAGTGSAQDPAELPWVDSLWDSIRRSATD